MLFFFVIIKSSELSKSVYFVEPEPTKLIHFCAWSIIIFLRIRMKSVQMRIFDWHKNTISDFEEKKI